MIDALIVVALVMYFWIGWATAKSLHGRHGYTDYVFLTLAGLTWPIWATVLFLLRKGKR